MISEAVSDEGTGSSEDGLGVALWEAPRALPPLAPLLPLPAFSPPREPCGISYNIRLDIAVAMRLKLSYIIELKVTHKLVD